MSATAREIAERLCNKLYPAGDYWRVDEFTEIISSALEARERDVHELCEAADGMIESFELLLKEANEHFKSPTLAGVITGAFLNEPSRIRTALAKLRAGEQKGTE
jgi:hypothetical protein